MKLLTFLLLLGLFTHCSTKNQNTTLSVGNQASYTAAGDMQVAGSKTLTKADTLYFLLSRDELFNEPAVTFKVYKITNGQQQMMASVDVKTIPSTKYLRSRYLVKELISNYGYGDFLAQFVSGEEVIAENTFSLAER